MNSRAPAGVKPRLARTAATGEGSPSMPCWGASPADLGTHLYLKGTSRRSGRAVSRVLYRFRGGGHPSKRPTRRSGRTGSPPAPEGLPSLFGLAPDGVCLFSLLPLGSHRLCGTFRALPRRGVSPRVPPCGARTFLSRNGSDRPPGPNDPNLTHLPPARELSTVQTTKEPHIGQTNVLPLLISTPFWGGTLVRHPPQAPDLSPTTISERPDCLAC